LEQLPDEYEPGIERKLLAAYATTEYADARLAFEQSHRGWSRFIEATQAACQIGARWSIW
jgi:hypothetical protein